VTAIVTEIVDWLRPAFTTVGYAIVPTAMFLESAAFLGVLIPGDVILAVAGVYAAAGEMSVPIVIVLGIAGALAGETAGYVVGRRYGRSAIGHLPFADRIGRKVDRTSDAIHANAGKTIVAGRFATGVAGVVPFAAGMADVPTRTFFLYSVPLVVGWATGVVLLGTLVGNNVELIDRILSSIGWFVLGALILVVAVRWAWRRRRSADPSS
jgi:membrane protein DedA with SNARE-associated domain